MQDGTGWHWQLWAANGNPLARNAVAYDNQKSCIQAIRTMMKQVRKANVVMRSNVDE